MGIKMTENAISRIDQKLQAYGVDPDRLYDSYEFETLRVFDDILLEMKNSLATVQNEH